LPDFYSTVILYYQRLPTWGWLNAAGIKPSNTTNYTLSDIQAALTKAYGQLPYLGCSGPKYNSTPAGAGSNDSGSIYLDEVWYYFYVYGKPQYGTWVPQNASVSNSAVTTCAKAKGAIRYLERTPGSTWS
jgi:ribonuclease T2